MGKTGNKSKSVLEAEREDGTIFRFQVLKSAYIYI